MLTDAFRLQTRRSRIVFFLICSPLLIPLLCASIPILCAAEIFSRLRSRHPWFAKSVAEEDDLRLRRCEEGCGCGGFGPEEETGLLQRYLEDQLILVRSVYDCGDDDDPVPFKQLNWKREEDKRFFGYVGSASGPHYCGSSVFLQDETT